jgi:type III secretion protein J
VIITGCDEQILHDLTEQDANKVVSRLSTGSIGAKKVLQSDGRWAISVPRGAIVPALAYLDTNRVLAPRSAASTGSGKGGFVPSREEQWFRYERSVASAIEDSLATVQGVLEARVHLNLPETDPLFGTRKENVGSGSVLLVIDDRFISKDEEISSLVAGAAGVPAAKVTVLRSHTTVRPAEYATSTEGVEAAKVVYSHSDSYSDTLLQPEVGIASAAVATLMGIGLFVLRGRRRKVKFPLPAGTQLDDQ